MFQASTGRQALQIYCGHAMGARPKNGGLQEGREGPLGGEGLPGPGLERRNCWHPRMCQSTILKPAGYPSENLKKMGDLGPGN